MHKKNDDIGIKPTTYLLLLAAFCVLWVIAKCTSNMDWPRIIGYA